MILIGKFNIHLSGNRNAKRSRYSFSVLSVNSHKVQAAGSQTFTPVYQPEPPTPRKEEEALKSPKYKIFTFNDLAVATRKFHHHSLLGEGGFGCVYKGWIDQNTLAAMKWGTGLAIAVKRLNVEGFQGCAEWMVSINLSPNLLLFFSNFFQVVSTFLVKS